MSKQQSDIAVDYANQIQSMVQQIANLRAQVNSFLAINAVGPVGNLVNALNTTPLLADGSLGTADTLGTPVSGHYVDPRIYPNLGRVVKNTDLTNGIGVLTDFQTWSAGTSLATNGARPGQINALGM